MASLTLMILVANLANTEWCKISEKWLKPWQMGTHLRVLSESFPMNTNTTGLLHFPRIYLSESNENPGMKKLNTHLTIGPLLHLPGINLSESNENPGMKWLNRHLTIGPLLHLPGIYLSGFNENPGMKVLITNHLLSPCLLTKQWAGWGHLLLQRPTMNLLIMLECLHLIDTSTQLN